MPVHITYLALIGALGMMISWAPVLTKKTGLSYALALVALGFGVYSCFGGLPVVTQYRDQPHVLHFTEIIVLIALMSTGLRLDYSFSFRKWSIPLRLVTIAMVISIAALGLLGYYFLGLGVASALLLGAALAPTDPVLAADIQVGPPNAGKNDAVRFALTAEAGFNDGMAFPFVLLAIGLVTQSGTTLELLAHWAWFELAYRLLAGIAIGFAIGKLVTYLFFYLPNKYKQRSVREGLVAIATTLLVYGITELIHGYGFIAVFIAALTIRSHKMEHDYHARLHAFTDEVERWIVAVLLILFGGALAEGIMDHLTWPLALVGLVFVLVIRPVAALTSLIGSPIDIRDKLAISFFGIRGVGSFYYLAFAFHAADFPYKDQIWSLTSFIVVVSVIVHGITASFAMNYLQKWHERTGSPADCVMPQ